MASGSASVKKPPPWIGGSCAGSPSTNSGTPNDIRSRASSPSTIEHSSMTMSLALEAGASSHRSKLRVSSPPSRAREIRLWLGAAPGQPLLRITHAALPVKAEQDLAVDALGEVLGKRRLARSGITEEAKIGIGGQDGGPPSIRTEREHLSRHGSAARTPRSTHAHDCGASREEESYRRRRGERCAQGR